VTLKILESLMELGKKNAHASWVLVQTRSHVPHPFPASRIARKPRRDAGKKRVVKNGVSLLDVIR